MEQAPKDERPMEQLSEGEKTERVLKCIQSPTFDFLKSLTHIDGNPFYKNQ